MLQLVQDFELLLHPIHKTTFPSQSQSKSQSQSQSHLFIIIIIIIIIIIMIMAVLWVIHPSISCQSCLWMNLCCFTTTKTESILGWLVGLIMKAWPGFSFFLLCMNHRDRDTLWFIDRYREFEIWMIRESLWKELILLKVKMFFILSYIDTHTHTHAMITSNSLSPH